MQSTDILVIGAGFGGYVAALRLAQAGKKVIIVEKDPFLGGVCLHKGCIPTKSLVTISELYHAISHSEHMGIHGEGALNEEGIRAWKDKLIDKLSKGISFLCTHQNVTIMQGKGRFTSPTTAVVALSSGEDEISFQQAIIATGSLPREIPGFSFEHDKIWSSDDAVNLPCIPGHLTIIGGGYIGIELGISFRKLGSQVHVLEAGNRLLPLVEEDLTLPVIDSLNSLGVASTVSAKATSWKEENGKVIVAVEGPEGAFTITTDRALVVVGRGPATKDLGLELALVNVDDHGFIAVNDRFSTSQPHIFAVGDVIGGQMLAHKARMEGRTVAEVIIDDLTPASLLPIPWVIYSDPEIASVGISAEKARGKGIEIEVSTFSFSVLGRALTLDQPKGFLKLVSEKHTGKVIGVHCVGANASEIIGEATLAVRLGASVTDLADTIHAHPTMAEALLEASEEPAGKPVHSLGKKEQQI